MRNSDKKGIFDVSEAEAELSDREKQLIYQPPQWKLSDAYMFLSLSFKF